MQRILPEMGTSRATRCVYRRTETNGALSACRHGTAGHSRHRGGVSWTAFGLAVLLAILVILVV
ncbi:MAG TPA: hypothetical protein VFH23_07110 [Jiangellaceae bacterium]|nr:hypothetical protein [Jiangellaceae bacterium]